MFAAARILVVAVVIVIAAPAAALQPGDRCPDFDLPRLGGDGRAQAGELLTRTPLTVFLFWNRECPHCTDMALSVDYLAEAVRIHGAQVVPIVFGPDDPAGLRLLLEDEGVTTPQLWDAGASVASAYDLGFEHLGVFVAQADGKIHAVFHSEVSDLLGDVTPAVAKAAETAGDVVTTPAPLATTAKPAAGPSFQTDGRFRFVTTEGARAGDLGLYGEGLESGALLLLRWDLRMRWEVAPGIAFVPRLRVGNEDEVFLTEGPEQFSSPHGTASLLAERGRWSATLGAFPLRISPLLMQRWDDEDAPPLGGVSGCSTCGAGASGLSQRSLEVLGPNYTFEGASARWSQRMFRVRAWGAVTRWEQTQPARAGVSREDSLAARYRRVMHGVTVDLGPGGALENRFGLPRPWGVRVGYLSLGDDARTVGEESISPTEDWEERGVSVLAAAGSWRGLSADAEHLWWQGRRAAAQRVWDGGWVTRWSTEETDARALRAGVRGQWPMGRARLWARAHRLWVEPGYHPVYAALTYDGNRQGWRGALGFDGDETPSAGPRFLGASVFYRWTEETKPTEPEAGSLSETIGSVTVRGRAYRFLEAQIHGVRSTLDYPNAALPDEENLGISLDLRWTAWSAVDPVLRVDAIRRDDGRADPHTVWQTYFWLRVLQ